MVSYCGDSAAQEMMKKRIYWKGLFICIYSLIAFVLINTWSAYGDDGYGSVQIAPREWGAYRAHLPEETKIRWQADWVLERVDEGPPARYVMRDELRGAFGEDNREQIRITDAEFILDRGRIRMQHSLLTVRDREGKVVFILEKEFDHKNGEVKTRAAYPLEKEKEIINFEMGELLVDTKEIFFFLRGFPFPSPEEAEEADLEMDFTLLNEEPDTYSMTATYEGIEEIKTPAGTFVSHKLRLVPDMGIFTFLGKMFSTDIYIWFTVAPPHFWVKHEGLEGDGDTPSVISESVEFNNGPYPVVLPTIPLTEKE